jgi:hypothetical protein
MYQNICHKNKEKPSMSLSSIDKNIKIINVERYD